MFSSVLEVRTYTNNFNQSRRLHELIVYPSFLAAVSNIYQANRRPCLRRSVVAMRSGEELRYPRTSRHRAGQPVRAVHIGTIYADSGHIH